MLSLARSCALAVAFLAAVAASINLNTLRQMVEWDSRMKFLTNGERIYLADLAYELKPLNSFHKEISKKHLNKLIENGFTSYAEA
jgi:hypothetical protein